MGVPLTATGPDPSTDTWAPLTLSWAAASSSRLAPALSFTFASEEISMSPVPFSTVGRRTVSNVPAQSLILMNDPFVLGEARRWARGILTEAGTVLGTLRASVTSETGLAAVPVVAPASHDTGSAVAAVPATGTSWAYISSGTWSLVGMVLDEPRNDAAVAAENFTNLGAVGGRVCFHKNVNGMWLIRQCMDKWAAAGREWTVPELVAAAEGAPKPQALLEVDDLDLLLAGKMPHRINAQLQRRGLQPLDEGA